ncbi:MAG: N-acetylglucosamine-6-phosphate deacetylase [Desulfurococcaceae archaeon]
MRLTLRHLTIASSSKLIEDGYVVVERGIIRDVGREPLGSSVSSEVNLSGYIAVPGFIDTHTHGVKGLDVTSNPEPHRILEMSKHYVKHGVTSYVPTTVTAPHEVIIDACRAVREARLQWTPIDGSRILGVHLEGPYINPKAAGAQNTAYIRKPSIKELQEYIDASGKTVVQITIAPEIDGALDLIRYASSVGITVSAGHTDSSYEEGVKAVELGVSKATHIFNGMTRFHHREPGIALALLQSPRVFIELIADFIHIHPAVVKMIIDLGGSSRITLITDSIAATDMPDGIYELGGLKVIVEKGVCKLLNTGSLAGSTLTMDKAFKNVVKLGYSLMDAAAMASTTPAKSINVDEKLKIGDIRAGYVADIAILNKELEVVKTIIEGSIVYEKE